jgi:hypothetical protein
MTSFLTNNRQIQKSLETYKTKSEIDEALFLLKQKYSPVAYKIFKFILHTKGVTQAKISAICEAVGISESYFHRVVKHEINERLGEEILKMIPTQKLDRTRSKKVRGSFYKILAPLNKIKYLFNESEKKETSELQAFLDDLSAVPGVESSDESSVESDSEIPSESKTEDEKSDSHLKSFRENLSEKDLKTLIKDDQNFKISFPKIGIKKEIKKYMDSFPLFRDFSNWSQAKKYEVARTLQLAIVKHDADLQETKIQYMIKNAIAAFSEKYLKKPQDEFLRLFYTYVSNALKNTQEDDSESNEDQTEDDQEYFSPLFKKIIEKKVRQDRPTRQESVSRQDLDDLGVF